MSIVVVGLGRRGAGDHIPAVLESKHTFLAGVVDSDVKLARKMGLEFGVPFASSVEDLVEAYAQPPEAALIAVPHNEYLPIVESLARAGVHIIKDKPYAVSIEEARRLNEIVSSTGISLHVTLQRRFDPVYQNFLRLTSLIGRIHAIEARYTMNVKRLDEGWRANSARAGGGALLDLGYHYVDLMVWYFGLPDLVSCHMTARNRPDQDYNTEDTAFVQFAFKAPDHEPDVLGNLIVSRVFPDHDESLTAFGTAGSASVSRGRCQRRDVDGKVVERLSRQGTWPLVEQLEQFVTRIRSGLPNGRVARSYLEHVAFIDAAYRSARSGAPTSPHDSMRMLEE